MDQVHRPALQCADAVDERYQRGSYPDGEFAGRSGQRVLRRPGLRHRGDGTQVVDPRLPAPELQRLAHVAQRIWIVESVRSSRSSSTVFCFSRFLLMKTIKVLIFKRWICLIAGTLMSDRAQVSIRSIQLPINELLIYLLFVRV